MQHLENQLGMASEVTQNAIYLVIAEPVNIQGVTVALKCYLGGSFTTKVRTFSIGIVSRCLRFFLSQLIALCFRKL